MAKIEDYDFLDLEGEFIIMPEEEFYESVFWAKDTIFKNNRYIIIGMLFNLSSQELDSNFGMSDDYYYSKIDEMDLLENNQYRKDYKRLMIEMMFY